MTDINIKDLSTADEVDVSTHKILVADSTGPFLAPASDLEKLTEGINVYLTFNVIEKLLSENRVRTGTLVYITSGHKVRNYVRQEVENHRPYGVAINAGRAGSSINVIRKGLVDISGLPAPDNPIPNDIIQYLGVSATYEHTFVYPSPMTASAEWSFLSDSSVEKSVFWCGFIIAFLNNAKTKLRAYLDFTAVMAQGFTFNTSVEYEDGSTSVPPSYKATNLLPWE